MDSGWGGIVAVSDLLLVGAQKDLEHHAGRFGTQSRRLRYQDHFDLFRAATAPSWSSSVGRQSRRTDRVVRLTVQPVLREH
jgi:hypothetical protein